MNTFTYLNTVYLKYIMNTFTSRQKLCLFQRRRGCDGTAGRRMVWIPNSSFFPAESWIIYNMPSGYFALSFSWQRKQQSNRCVSRSEQPGEGVRRAMGEGRGRGRIREQWERWVVEVGVGDRREGGSGRGMWGGRGRKRGKWAGRRRGGEGIGKW